MIIPSFNDYAPKPDLAGAYLGGVAAAQRDRAQDDEVAHRAQQLQLAQQKLQQDAVENQMQFQARQQQLQQDSMLQDQRLRIDQQYKQQMIGMDQIKIEQAGQKLQFEFEQETKKAQAQQRFQTLRQQYGEAQIPDSDEKALRETAPEMGLNGAALARIYQDRRAQIPQGVMKDIEGDKSGRFKSIQTGPETIRVIDTERSGGDLAQRRFEFSKEKAAQQSIKDQIRSLEKVNESTTGKIGMFAQYKLDRGDKLTPAQQKSADQYNARLAEIESLRKRLGVTQADAPSASSGQSRFKEGQIITHKKTGDKYRVTDGRPVLIDSGGEDDESSGEDNLGE